MTSYNMHAMQRFCEKVKTAILTEAHKILTAVIFWYCSKLYYRSLFQNNKDIYFIISCVLLYNL
jgi:hypothetical protein